MYHNTQLLAAVDLRTLSAMSVTPRERFLGSQIVAALVSFGLFQPEEDGSGGWDGHQKQESGSRTLGVTVTGHEKAVFILKRAFVTLPNQKKNKKKQKTKNKKQKTKKTKTKRMPVQLSMFLSFLFVVLCVM